jgi:plasmid stabilization system protein ParE
VARVRYQRRAEDDLDSIAEYSLERWGQARTERYVKGLQQLCEHLDELPILNRPHDGPYLRRAYESHVVFFRRPPPVLAPGGACGRSVIGEA